MATFSHEARTKARNAAMKRWSAAAVLAALVFALCFSQTWTPAQAQADEPLATTSFQTRSADDAVDVTLEVTYGQTDARSMLDMINEFRTGDDAWAWSSDDSTQEQFSDLAELQYDYELERIAMTRATEIAVYFDHLRPDGVTRVSSMLESHTFVAENIACGQTSAEEAFESWQESDENYQGQGHRRNMLTSKGTHVGIGHVIYNGYDYWVQVFAAPGFDDAMVEANDSEETVVISVASSLIDDYSLEADPQDIYLTVGESCSLPTVSTSITTAETWPPTSFPVVFEDLNWSVDDTDVAYIEESELVAQGPGSTTLWAETPLGEVSAYVSVEEEEPEKIDISEGELLGFFDRAYTGYDIYFNDPFVKLNGQRIYVYDNGFMVTYFKDGEEVDWVEDAGTYTVEVTADGDYFCGSLSTTFNVVEGKKDFTEARAYCKDNAYRYDYEPGVVQKPLDCVYFYDEELDEDYELDDSDYTVVYQDANGDACDPEEPGYYSIVLTGRGDFVGQVECSFEIVNMYDFANYNLELANSAVVYQANVVQAPAFSLIDKYGESVLPESAYDVTVMQWDPETGDYVQATEQEVGGRYILLVEPKSPYIGEPFSPEFTVVEANDLAAADVQIEECWGHDEVVNPGVTVTLGGTPLAEGVDYEKTWGLYEDDDYVEVDGPSSAHVTYFLEISGKEGTKYAGTQRKVPYMLSEPSSIRYVNYRNEKECYEATGKPVDLGVTLTWQEEQLVEGIDYKITYKDADTGNDLDGAPSAGGDYIAVFEGLNRFNDERYYYFAIIDPYDLESSASASVSCSQFFAGSAPKHFSVTVRVRDVEDDWVYLANGADYTVTGYQIHSESGWSAAEGFDTPSEYRAVINGNSPYHGTLYAKFTVLDPTNLEQANVELWKKPLVRGADITAPVWRVQLNRKYLARDVDYAVKYFDAETGAEVSGPLGVGSYRAEFTPASDNSYKGKSTYEFEVRDALELSNASFDLDRYTYPYTGEPVVAEIDYAVAWDGEELVPNKDYELAYYYYKDEDEGYVSLDGVPTEIGDYAVSIKPAQGSLYEGESGKEYLSIIDDSDLTRARFSIGYTVYPATDKPVELDVDYVRTAAGTQLEQGVDYEFVFKDGDGTILQETPSAIGDYSVTIKAVESSVYAGTCKTWNSFRIVNKNDLSLAEFSLKKSAYVATGSPISVEASYAEAYDGTELVQGKDYEFVYRDDEGNVLSSAPSEIGSYQISIKAAENSKYTGESDEDEWAYIRIVNQNDLSAGSLSLEKTRYRFTGDPVALSIKAAKAADGADLVLGTDYELVYRDGGWNRYSDIPSEPGSYYVSLKGIGKYTGESNTTWWFNIYDPYFLSDSYYFTASAQSFFAGEMPEDFGVKVRYYDPYEGTIQLEEGIDFTAAIERECDEGWFPVDDFDGTVPGNYRFAATGNDPYYDVRDALFQVKDPKDISNADFYHDEFVARDGGVTPTWRAWLNGTELVEQTHYAVTYYRSDEYGDAFGEPVSTPLKAGEYCAEFIAIDDGGYVGTTSEWFSVEDATDLANASFWLNKQIYAATGSPVQLSMSAVLAADDVELKTGTDYELYFEDENGRALDGAPSEVGSYYVGIKTAAGSAYSGKSGTRWFSIVDANDLANSNFDLSQYVYAYDGNPVILKPVYARAFGGTPLELGADFEFYFLDEDENELDGAPSAIGEYSVGIRALPNSAYTGKTYAWANIRIVPANHLALASVELDSGTFLYTGNAIAPVTTVTMNGNTLVAGTDYDVKYYTYDDWAGWTTEVDSPKEIGEYKIEIIGKGSYQGEADDLWFDILSSNELRVATVSGVSGTYTYTGQPIAPTPKVVDALGNELIEGTHYKYRFYAHDEYDEYPVDAKECIEPGNYIIVITAIDGGGYTGERWVYYRIIEKTSDEPVDISNAAVTAADQEYSGKGLTPAVTVRLNGAVVPETGYSVTYENNTNAGTATIKVTGVGTATEGYTGTATGTFTIAPKAVTVTANNAAKTYGAADPALTATVTGLVEGEPVSLISYTLTRVAGEDVRDGGYDIQATGSSLQGNYSVSFVNGTLTINPMSTVIGITGKTASFVYDGDEHTVSGYDITLPEGAGLSENDIAFTGTAEARGVEVGTHSMGLDASMFSLVGDKAGNYDATFSVIDGCVTIRDSGTEVIDLPTPAELTYNGQEQEGVAKGNHFTVQGGSGTNAGSYSATLTADDGYEFPSGKTATIAWSIKPKAVTVAPANASKTYGAADPKLTATVTGTLDGDVVNYSVARVAGENVGTYDIIASGEADQGNYAVAFQKGTFTINRVKVTVKVLNASKTYGAGDPEFDVDVQGLVGQEPVSYELSRAAGENVGTYAIYATGEKEQGNYDVAFENGTFTISARSISSGTIAGLAAKTFTGKAITQNPSLTVGGKKLVLNTDFKVSYKNNTNAGTATVTITGKGNYSGTKTASFKINKASQTISAKSKIAKTFKGKKLVKAKKLAKKQTINVKSLTKASASTTVKYKLTVPKKAKKAKKFLSLNGTTGKLTVKKGLPKGKYAVKVTLTADASANYNAAPSKTVTLTITVK